MAEAQNHLLRSFPIVLEMLEYRQIDVSALREISQEDLMAMASESSLLHISVSETMSLLYNLGTKMSTKDMKSVIPEEIDTLLYISQEMPNAGVCRNIAKIRENLHVQIFAIGELLYNITKHELVPLHVAIRDPDQIQALMQQFRLRSRTQFPHIQQDDAMARFLDLRPGQLVEIHRVSPSSGITKYYRCCV